MAAELFTSSITSRRFPALRGLTADDVDVMALPQRPTPDRKAKPAAAGKGSRLFDPDLVKPSAVTNLSPMAGARSGLDAGRAIAGSTTSKASSPKKEQEPRPTWRPGGKTHHSLVPENGYVMIHSPFDMGFRQRQQERLAAASMRLAGGFHPPSASQAKGDVSVNYYLNSADAETLEAERRYIQEKARAALPTLIHTPPRRAPLAWSRPQAALARTRAPPPHALPWAGWQARRNMIEYNRRMRQQLAVMREAANRGAQTCSLALLPSPQPSHTRGSVHTPWTACPIAPSRAVPPRACTRARPSVLPCLLLHPTESAGAPSQLAPWPDRMRRADRGRGTGWATTHDHAGGALRRGGLRSVLRLRRRKKRSVFSPGLLFLAQPLAQVLASPPWPRLGVAITGVGKRGRGTGA